MRGAKPDNDGVNRIDRERQLHPPTFTPDSGDVAFGQLKSEKMRVSRLSNNHIGR
jgi:hypothetical protein